ncbi:MAG: HAMP domain-containing histidine kinase [Flavobacteriales bacterium]|nr:HAMP domain-containing histidine kinase [Flavobacteriales bacterium]
MQKTLITKKEQIQYTQSRMKITKRKEENLEDIQDKDKIIVKKLVDAEKMSSLGQLTAGIAHEINNPINFVSSNIAPLRQDIEDVNTIIKKYEELETADNIPEKLKEIETLKKELDFEYLKTELSIIIDGIEDGAKRTTEIVSGLRNFARLDEGELKNANINEGIESTLILIKNKLKEIKIKKSLNKIPNIDCNPGKINQMVMNLIDNAIYAIDKSENENKDGLIIVTTESNKGLIKLTIKDNGVGIADKIKDKLFDPFFTTKDVGEGTGLGLSIVRSIVDNHGGKIIVNSEINKGTEIIVEIPIKRTVNGKD